MKEQNHLSSPPTKEELKNREVLEPKYNIPDFLTALALIVLTILVGDVIVRMF